MFLQSYLDLVALDYIAGQFDRNYSNVLITFSKGQGSSEELVFEGLTAIDSDYSWGSKEIPCAQHDGNLYYHEFRDLPQFISPSLAEKILKMTKADIQLIGDKRLTKSEIQAAQGRLKRLQAAISSGKIGQVQQIDRNKQGEVSITTIDGKTVQLDEKGLSGLLKGPH